MLKAIDLFSGCGGLSVGLKQAGFDVIAAVENESLAAKVYKMNHKSTLVLQKDICTVNPRSLKKTLDLKIGELDLLAGCPPCQGFSTLRTKNGSKKINEPLNDLLFQFEKFIEVFKPKCVMMENVPGLAKDRRLTKFIRFLTSKGYITQVQVFNAVDFGVPQFRRRTVLIASRLGIPEFANKTLKRKTVKEVIGGLSRPGSGNDPLHDYKNFRSEKVTRVIKSIPKNGGSRAQLPKHLVLECHKETDGFKDVYGRMSWDQPGPTITGGCINPSKGRFLHPRQNRSITLREASLIQGFPKRYKFALNYGRYPIAQLIGNAFPPAFAKAHAKKLYCLILTNEVYFHEPRKKNTGRRAK